MQTTLETGSEDGMNLVMTGGGVAATLVAFLVHSVFEVCPKLWHRTLASLARECMDRLHRS